MRRLGMALFYTGAFMIFLMVFLPKTALYHELETLMKPFGVAIAGETPVDRGFDFVLKGGSLYYQDLHVADLGKITITPWLFYDSLEVAPFVFGPDMEGFTPPRVNGFGIRYSVFDPLHIRLKGDGEFGSVTGEIALAAHKISLELTPSAALLAKKPFWLKQLKSVKGGAYRYDTTY